MSLIKDFKENAKGEANMMRHTLSRDTKCDEDTVM